jgi:thiamine-phosphate diphosphorylase
MCCWPCKVFATGTFPLPRAPENSHAKPIVCYVTDSSALANSSAADHVRGALLARIVAAAQAGADWIQLREKNWHGRALLEFAFQVRARLAHLPTPPKLIINDRLDVALSASADGIQLGSSSLPLPDAIAFRREHERTHNAPKPFLVCASCHSIDEARAAESAGATHLFFGPVFDSPSKRHFGPPQGLERLAEIASAVQIPVIAIGGITSANAHSCIRTGASGVAAIREFQDLQDESRAKKFVEAVRR